MDMEKKLAILENWLDQKKTNHCLLAVKLGYKSSITVENWLRKRQIPNWVWTQLVRMLKIKEDEA